MDGITGSTIELKPNKTLKQYALPVPHGNALDMGIGGGRDALYLASIGYSVTAYDITHQFAEKCNLIARENNLDVTSHAIDLLEIDIPKESFDLITSSWILHSLKKSDSEVLVEKIVNGLKPGGMVILSLFSIDDPNFKEELKENKEIEMNTYYSKERNSFLHHFSKEEILSAFKSLRLITLIEKLNLDTGHGIPHYHGIIEYVGTKETIIPLNV